MRALIVVLVVASVLAGCASPQRPGTTGLPSMTPSSSVKPTDTPIIPPLGNATPPTIEFSGCDGTFIGSAVPRSRAEPYLPNGLQPEGVVPTTAGISATVLRCARVVTPLGIAEGIGLLWSGINVSPKNGSWAGDGFSTFTFDVLVSSEIVARALANAGVKAMTTDFNSVPTAAGEVTTEDWTLGSESLTYKVQFRHTTEKPSDAQLNPRTESYWSFDGSYNRTDAQIKFWPYHNHGLDDAALIEVTGSSQFDDLMGSEQSALASTNWFNSTIAIPLQPARFTEST